MGDVSGLAEKGETPTAGTPRATRAATTRWFSLVTDSRVAATPARSSALRGTSPPAEQGHPNVDRRVIDTPFELHGIL